MPFAPGLVVALGLVLSLVLSLLGLVQLRRSSDAGAAESARVLAAALVARVRVVAVEDRPAVLEAMGRATAADLVLVALDGTILAQSGVDVEGSLSSLVLAEHGFVETSTGRSAFAAAPLSAPFSHLALVVLVHAPASPRGARSLVWSVSIATVLVLVVAAYAAYRFGRSAEDDVEYVRARVARMAEAQGGPAGPEIPIRTLDLVGVVTSAFNIVLERFGAAERAYEQDLAQAEALDRARSRFLAALSHELRTPLNAILGFSDVLLSEVEGPLTPSAREDLEVVRKSAEHLSRLIDDVLDLSALEAGSLRLAPEPVDVTEVARDVIIEARALVGSKRLEIDVATEGDTTAIVDRKRLRQILSNLIGNAVKFTREGEVLVTTRGDERSVSVSVRDTGPGIDERERAVVFEEFRQAGELSERRKGTGLGLWFARRLVLAHGGAMTLESKPGEGAVFTVTFSRSEGRGSLSPVASEAPSSPEAPPA